MIERTHRNYLTVATAVFTDVALAGVLADAYRGPSTNSSNTS